MNSQNSSQPEQPEPTPQGEPAVQEHSLQAYSGARWRDRKLARWIMRFAICAIALVLLYLLGAVLLKSVSLHALQDVRQSLRDASIWFGFVRWAFIALLILYWEPLNRGLARRHHWSDSRLRRILSGRWLALGVLVLVELVFMQRLLESLIDGVSR
jgi:hypothetical protein